MRVLPATNVLNLEIADELGAGLWFFRLLGLVLLSTLALEWRVCCSLRLGHFVAPLGNGCHMLLQLVVIGQSEDGVILAVLALDGRLV